MKRMARRLAWGLGAIAWAGSQAVAQAQQTSGFVPATDVARESLPASPLLFGAYGFVWVALVAYVFLLWRRIGRVERELADVTARLAKR
jgi:CcmD family protein